MSPLLAVLVLLGVVDRIEGPIAVVEWEGRALADHRLDQLPSGLREGDRLRAVLRPPRRTSSPTEGSPWPDVPARWRIRLHPKRAAQRAARRIPCRPPTTARPPSRAP